MSEGKYTQKKLQEMTVNTKNIQTEVIISKNIVLIKN